MSAALMRREKISGLRNVYRGSSGLIFGKLFASNGMSKKNENIIEKQAIIVWLICGRKNAGNMPTSNMRVEMKRE
ncbi:MAG: hypothetical protein UZ14_CFX002000155 [Chloroflexi bacterium OLB14]|nr:MAG: hypothetical protein UZ14_CFX002000155 [Chloroflexi bacterium OLB14]